MKKIMTILANTALLAGLAAALAIWVALPWYGIAAFALVFALWMGLTRRGRQAASVTAVGISTLRQRLGSSAVIVIGIAGVVGVLVALLAMGEGYTEELRKTGSADTAIVLRGGSDAEVTSLLDRDSILAIGQGNEIARDSQGRPLVSPELVVAASLPLAGGGPDDIGSVQLRGVGAEAWAVRPNVRLIAGRRFRPGTRELVVGKAAQRQFSGLQVGRRILLGNQPWDVVGVFASGDAMESEIWADADVVAGIYHRG